jgi:gamma-glutamyltranspeptidase / glutathione hydrolase
MISTGHPLATAAGLKAFEQGGNATDAGVAAGFALSVLLPDRVGIGGVAPMLVLDGQTGRVTSIKGLGSWPASTRLDVLRTRWDGRIPRGVFRCVTPAAMGAWLTALSRYGRLRLEDVLASAVSLAEDGMPVYPSLSRGLAKGRDQYLEWPGTRATFLPDGEVPPVGSRLTQPELARTFHRLIAVSQRYSDRAQSIKAALDLFYRGDIAHEIAEFFANEGGWLASQDLEDFVAEAEEPARTTYRGFSVVSCGPWCQGPMLLQILNLLESKDLRELQHNSAAYIHFCAEAFKLVFADRSAFYGDPDWVDVPLVGLLSKGYASTRSTCIRLDQALHPTAGEPWAFEGRPAPHQTEQPAAGPLEAGTTYVCAVDAAGNAFSATPSDGIGNAPVIPGLGFAVSSRGAQSWLEDGHPSVVRPGKRPFLTPNPGLILKDGEIFAAFGTPGADTQPQAMAQFVANIIDFGMDLQEAVEQPRFATYDFPRADLPHKVEPNSLYLEDRIDSKAREDLRRLGHEVYPWKSFDADAGAICAVLRNRRDGFLVGAADPRRFSYAMGW